MKNMLIFLLLIFPGVLLAEQQAQALATDQRLKVVNFDRYNVIPVKGATFITTQIIFGQGEVIENIQNGDLAAWTVSIDPNLSNMLFLKPTVAKSETNMTVVTNQHTYYFQLSADDEKTHDRTYALRFTYPQANLDKVQRLIQQRAQQNEAIQTAFSHPSQYHWNYQYHGSKALLPVHVFDDGRFTYMQLQPHQVVPAVFAVHTADAQESVVNFRKQKQFLVIDQVAPQFTLRSGRQVVSLFNTRLIQQFKEQG